MNVERQQKQDKSSSFDATVASVIATVEDDTEVPVPRRTTRTQSVRLNLTATFNGFVPANNPDAWRDRDLE